MLVAQVPTLNEKKLSDTRSLFTIKPFEPGFGYTIGNALRRTLLASIPGAAITSIHISDVLYEFTTIKGVKEDVAEIVLNLKEVVLSMDTDEPQNASIKSDKEGKVLAKDINLPAGVKVHNPNLHIATLSKGAKLNIEMVIETGRGYVPAERNKDPKAELGRIAIDSIYSPVVKVGYKVDSTRSNDRTDFDMLTLDVETKSSISPKDALASASGTLENIYSYIHKLNDKVETIEIKDTDPLASFNALDNISSEEGADDGSGSILKEEVTYLELKPRGEERIKGAGVKTVEDLTKMTAEQISNLPGLGKSTVEDVLEKLDKYDLKLSE